jgi:MFS family permease
VTAGRRVDQAPPVAGVPTAGGDGGRGRDADGARLWTVTFTAAIAVNFLFNLVFYMLMTTMAVYAIGRFDADGTTAGLAASIFVLGALVCRLLSTVVVESVGALRLFFIGASVSLVVSLLYSVAEPLWVLLVVRFLHGAGFGLAHSAVGTIAQSILPRLRRGEGVGYFGTSATLGTALGPVAGLLAIGHWGYPGLFTVVTTVLVVALAGGLLLRTWRLGDPTSFADTDDHPSCDGQGPQPGIAPTPSEAVPTLAATLRRVLPIGLIAFFQSLAYASLAAFMDVHASARGFGEVAGSFFVVYASAVILVRLLSGRVVDRRGPASVVYPSVLLYAVALALVATAPTPLVLYLAAVLLGIGYGSLLPTGQTIAMALLPSRQSGTAFVWYFLFVDLGFGLGPFVLGALVDHLGTTVMILVGCGFVILAGVLFRTILPSGVRGGS